VGDDWFRGPGWSDAEREEFERRLARARSGNRSQYLRIKAIGLMEAGNREAAIGLLQRGLDTDDDGFETPGLLECLAEAVLPDDPALAERLLRQLLAEYPDLNATTMMAEVSLAEILISAGTRPALAEAYRLLDSWTVKRKPILLPANAYRRCLALIRLAEALGDHSSAKRMAGQARSWVESPAPFKHHPTVGRVQVIEDELHWLERLASGAEAHSHADGSSAVDGCGRMDELAAELAADEAYQRELTAWTAEDDERDAELRLAEEPLVDDLRAVGFDVESAWDLLSGGSGAYVEAIPVLLEHLERGGYPDVIIDGIGRVLAIKATVTHWSRLKAIYLAAASEAQADAAAIALSGCATSAQLEDLIEFLGLDDRGESRIFFLRPIRRLGRERGRAIIEGLRSHPVLGIEATAISKGRSRNS